MAERAPPRILTRQADAVALEQQGPEGERLRRRPLDLALGVQLGTGLELLGQLRVDREPLRVAGQVREEAVEHRPLDPGRQVRQHADRLGRPGRLDRRRRLGPGLVQRHLQPGLEVGQRLLGLLDRDVAPLDERLHVQLADAALVGDGGVHQGLGVAGVVALVVAVAPVAPHVDDDVLVEALAVLEGQPGHADARLGVVAVDVEDRRLHGLGHVAAVDATSGRTRAPS